MRWARTLRNRSRPETTAATASASPVVTTTVLDSRRMRNSLEVLQVSVVVSAVLGWLYLLLGRGMYWRADQRLPVTTRPKRLQLADRPSVVAIVPARNEAFMIRETLPSLLRQRYDGDFRVVLVDDESDDNTAEVAGSIGSDRLTVVRGRPTPKGWAGKVWGLAQGLEQAGNATYVLLTDADIAHSSDSVATLVRAAESDQRDLVSLMALLRTKTVWERALIPAFVYFFALLYPFRLVNQTGNRTAAAAGGCVLVRKRALDEAGIETIRDALIDDVALGALIKRNGSGRIWLGLSTSVVSLRPYPRLRDLWNMITRSAFTQLRYSWTLLAGTVGGLFLLFAVPPLAVVLGIGTDYRLAVPGAVAWLLLSLTFVPTLRLYELSPLRAVALPAIGLMYAGMTLDSARRHLGGRGGIWKGRTAPRSGFRA